MKKKFLLVVLLLVSMVLTLTSCNTMLDALEEKLPGILDNLGDIAGNLLGDDTGENHTCDWNNKLSFDETHHWYECSDCDKVKGKEAHSFSEWKSEANADSCENTVYTRYCYDCKKTETKVGGSHSFEQELFYDETHHWYECSDCDEVKGKEAHSFSKWTLTTDADNCEDDVYSRSCEDCNKVETKNASHSFGEWTNHNELSSCEERLYYRICSDCSDIEWRNGTYEDHDYKEEYLTDNSFHWSECKNCDATTEKVEHTLGDDGICTVCDAVVSATEGIVYGISTDGTYAEVLGYNGTATKIKIADTYMGLPVKVIYEKAFYENKSITSVIISNSVTSIGDYAFSYCYGLTSVTIPDSVTSIGDCAFYRCYSLVNITIPDSVEFIGEYAFYDCDSLTNMTIPDSVTSIGGYAFDYCSKLTSVTIGNSVTSIGDYAFSSCSSLTSITVDENNQYYKSIDGNLYNKDGKTLIQYAIGKEDTAFVIPDGVTTIGGDAFSNCSKLTSITIPDSVTSIGSSAFSNCSKLTSVTIPDSVTSIGNRAFYDCDSLTNVTVGNSVTSIGARAFYNCSKLTSITIPDSVTSIGDDAFYGCNSALYTEYEYGKYVKSGDNPYAVLIELTNKNFSTYTIHEDTKIIAYGVFSGCSRLTSITIPDSVTSIGRSAFYDCDSLTNVTIGSGVTYIGKDAFYNCNSLTSVTIGNGVTSIGEKAFYYCKSLTSVTIGNSVTSIGEEAFEYCSSLTSITVDENNQYYKSIDENLYSKDGKTLIQYAIGKEDTAFVIPDSVTSIGDFAFEDCDSLTSVTIGNGVTSIGDFAFEDCDSLTSVIIGNGVTSIGNSAFAWCRSLTDVYYTGTEEEWMAIGIASYGNYHLTGATIHYNYVPEE